LFTGKQKISYDINSKLCKFLQTLSAVDFRHMWRRANGCAVLENSRQRCGVIFKGRPPRCLETSGTNQSVIRRLKPEKRRPETKLPEMERTSLSSDGTLRTSFKNEIKVTLSSANPLKTTGSLLCHSTIQAMYCTCNVTLSGFRDTAVAAQQHCLIYSECVSIALIIQHAMRMRHITL
jgi:hypothetical protein